MTNPISNSTRIPSLDGLRAIAITLVIVGHMPHPPIPGLWRFDFGNIGVRIFFVISGFLITSLIVREQRLTGTVDLAAFFYRRVLRIMPAFYTFLVVMTAFVPWRDLLSAAVYLTDYVRVHTFVGHSWSLSVEEQFYLLWPCSIVILTLRRATMGCALVLIAAPIFRVLADYGFWPSPSRYAFECVSDALATGALLALFRERLWRNRRYAALISSPFAFVPGLLGIAVMAADPRAWVADLLGLPLLNLGLAMAIDRLTSYPAGLIGRSLNAAPAIWVGTLSYSLYLWQQPFTLSQLPIPIRLIGFSTCACASYYLVERPFLRLKGRVAREGPARVAS